MLCACPDKMVEHFALVAPVDEVRARVARIGAVADSFTLRAVLRHAAGEGDGVQPAHRLGVLRVRGSNGA